MKISTIVKGAIAGLILWALIWFGIQWLNEYRMIQRGQEVSNFDSSDFCFDFTALGPVTFNPLI